MPNNKKTECSSKLTEDCPNETLSNAVNREFTAPVIMTEAGAVKFTQVIRIDLDVCEDGFGLTVCRMEFDAKKEFPCVSENLQIKLARLVYEALRDDDRKICKLKNLACLFESSSKSAEWKELFDAVGFVEKLSEYRPVVSSYDINFRGKAAVIYRSNVGNLVFRPKPLIFNNDRDRMYYRNICLTDDFNNRQCTMQNAWDSGDAINKLKDKTPHNQEHKIDLSMVLGVKEYCKDENGDDTTDYIWLLTPIKIDPPVDNDGTGN